MPRSRWSCTGTSPGISYRRPQRHYTTSAWSATTTPGPSSHRWPRPPKRTGDLVLSVRVVDDLDGAIAHVQRYSSGHTEAIVTRDLHSAQRFTREVDAAAVIVNASTRFTDGEQFGFGAEIGISTQKLHARGPMGVRQLTTTKYIVTGEGQIRT
jgi:hypothetical protein